MSKEYKKPEKYVPGPNDLALPPQLSEFKNKTTDEVLEELNRMPFFMTQLDESNGEGGENTVLEALKAMAYEGEPHEIATNFKNQGNDLYKVKRFQDARDMYDKGIDIKCDDKSVNESLFANKAMCELELKNYRSCVNNCKNALALNPKNIKCYFRMGKAFFALDKLEEAMEAVQFGLKIDFENKSLQTLLATISKRDQDRRAYQEKRQQEEQRKKDLQSFLSDAILLRNVKNITTNQHSEFLKEATVKLENPMDFESQMIYPTIIMYPTTNEFDFIAETGELSTIQEIIDMLMDRPAEWFEAPGHENFGSKKLLAYMETESGGLIKAGKKLTIHDILKKDSPKVPVFDNALKVYLVPKSESEQWIAKWDKVEAIKRRV
ncbi:similar to Saccharomyces cerevisiae YBR155W CNS1 TPR-containing co-chaperone [Maudiozyma saulgeensis]|uniref:Similar to Saccharomyces cerevisiae YBR155W CNS1 TPR-containing co-chaperone n=1 Tax=Maudiozyma saulgeensis TaxID=1789683 RepID=A0A1X7R5K5_9SACH|nr:similar to Saccharomyces cerevisiae YBR155W CNS1 TPR-containing co-chaperone [Kazachstania saulgeensis]